jgi:hypothetical protein
MPRTTFSLNTRTKVTIDSSDAIEPKLLEILMKILYDKNNHRINMDSLELAYQWFKKGIEKNSPNTKEELILEMFEQAMN